LKKGIKGICEKILTGTYKLPSPEDHMLADKRNQRKKSQRPHANTSATHIRRVQGKGREYHSLKGNRGKGGGFETEKG